MFETFCLRLAAGMVLSLFVLSPRVVHPRFFRIHLIITLGLIAAGAMAAWQGGQTESARFDWFWLALGVAGGACLVGSWSWSPNGLPSGYACLCLGLVSLIAALVVLHASLAVSPLRHALIFLDDLTGSAVLGLATTAMLMGHWYLIAPTMSLAPLERLLLALSIALICRLIPAAMPLLDWLNGQHFDFLAWMWLAVRWATGIFGPLALVWMTWQTVKLCATQSATGILYVVVIFCFFGELTDQLLQSHMQALAKGTA